MSTYAFNTETFAYRCIESGWPLLDGEVETNVIPPKPVSKQFDDYIKSVADGVSAWLSGYVAETYGYDNIVSAASYAGDKNPKFNAEGTAARAWRSDCFIALYAALPTYAAMAPDQWPTMDYIIANLPQPIAYQWEPS